jgi:DNA mismatch repair protein MutS
MLPVDRHTLTELQIIAERGQTASILHFFDRTKTQGGRDTLRSMLLKPKENLVDTLSFQDLLKCISVDPEPWQIDIPRAYVLAAEAYSVLNVAHSMSQDVVMHWLDTMVYFVKNPEEFYRIQSGLAALWRLLTAIQNMLTNLQDVDIPEEITLDINYLKDFLSEKFLIRFLSAKDGSLSKKTIFYADYFFRVDRKNDLRLILDIYYKFDAWLAIVETAKHHQLAFPEFTQGKQVFLANAMWHPLVNGAVPNHFNVMDDRPLCIITGANTSGKTTFLKTCGITVYLAHLGWPVPAATLTLSFADRLFTSIHLSDDLNLGYSHFYNEMMRVKQIAESLEADEHCFVIIDELFRGTNRDDALVCSKKVIDGFLFRPGSLFLISTHLLELLESYQNAPDIDFQCFQTSIKDNSFENSFHIEQGIATAKVGYMIMEQTGVASLLEQTKRRPNH